MPKESEKKEIPRLEKWKNGSKKFQDLKNFL